jgi:small subunit ribosomal protein S20
LVNPTPEKAAQPAVKSSSAEKAARIAIKRHRRNKSIRSQVKTDITTAEKLIFTGDIEGARAAVTAVASALDKAAGKKILHANNAARRKSRLMKKLDKAKAQPPAAAKTEKAA